MSILINLKTQLFCIILFESFPQISHEIVLFLLGAGTCGLIAILVFIFLTHQIHYELLVNMLLSRLKLGLSLSCTFASLLLLLLDLLVVECSHGVEDDLDVL